MTRNAAISTAGNLDALFKPQSVAVVGASDMADKVGGRTLSALLAHNFSGLIYPVNPNRPTTQGQKAYSSLAAIPEPIDLAILCVPARDVEGNVAEACRLGIRAIIILTSGFAELGQEGAEAQDRIAAIAREHGVALLGPNCLGLVNGNIGLAASSTVMLNDRRVKPGRISFVSQSGAIATFWMDAMNQRGIGVSKWVSTGNEASLSLSDILSYLVDDPETDVIGIYVEGFREGTLLRRALAKAAAKHKPIIVLRAGRSETGAQATASHTGALSGEDALQTALLAQYGACQVDSLRQMIDLSRFFLSQQPNQGRRTCVISLSGGAGALIADGLEKIGLDLPQPSPALLAKLTPLFPAYIQARNPIDLSDQILRKPEMFGQVADLVMRSGEYDFVVTFMAGRSPRLMSEAEKSSVELFPKWNGSYATIWISTETALIARLGDVGVLVYEEITDAIDAIGAAVKAAETWSSGVPSRVPPGLQAGPSIALTEMASKAMLGEALGIDRPLYAVAHSHEAWDGNLPAADRFVAKLQSAALLHKSGNGAIDLGLRTAAEVRASVDRMLAMATSQGLPQDGVLIEKMEAIVHEFLVGLRRDPVFGPYLVIGRGGVTVELDPDVATRFLPVSADDVIAMLRSLRSAKLLDGFRDKPPVALPQLAETISDLCTLFESNTNLAEIEINPLAQCAGDRIVVIDAAVQLYGA